MIADITKRLNQNNSANKPNSPLNSFWSRSKRDPDQVNVVTKVLTEENRLSSIEHDFRSLILSAASIFSTKKEVDSIELHSEPETKPEGLAVTRVDNGEPDIGNIMMAFIAGVSLLMAGFAKKIYNMLTKSSDKLTDSLGNVIVAGDNSLDENLDIGNQNKPKVTRETIRQQVNESSPQVSLEKEKEYDMNQVKAASSIMSSNANIPNRKSSIPFITSVDKDNEIKKADIQPNTDISIAIDYSEGYGDEKYQGDIPTPQQSDSIFGRIWDAITGRTPPKNPSEQVKLPEAKLLSDKEVEGISAKAGVDLREANPSILDKLKKIEKDIGYTLVVSSTVSDHRRSVGPDRRHDSGLAIDISYNQSPILQTEVGRTLVLKAALKEGITGIGFEGSHMHIDLVPGMKAHWPRNYTGPGNGFTPEQEKLFGMDPSQIALPVISPPPAPPPAGSKGNKSSSSSSWWQSVESYFGAEEPAQGNKHHAGT